MLKTNRRFGIEFEFLMPQPELSKIARRIIGQIYGAGYCVSKDEKYSTLKELNKWHIKRENDEVGEINTPISKLKDLSRIARVISILAKKKVPVGDGCGLHVHIEVKDVDKYNLVGFWLQCEKCILECFPSERRKSISVEKLIKDKSDCKKYIAEILEHNVNTASHGDIISLHDYDDRHTVEFRIAEGTTDSIFVTNWIRFLLYWIEYTKNLHPATVPCHKCNSLKIDDLLSLLSVDDETNDFMLWRHKKYCKLPYWVK